jgi:hypothetical protein
VDDVDHTWDIVSKVICEDADTLHVSGRDKTSPHDDASNALLKWYIRLGHLSMRRIQSLASNGKLPGTLARCKVPLCTGCLYGKMTRQPWRHKGTIKHIADDVTVTWQRVSVDQMYSSIPGLVGQMKCTPTRKRYKVATAFVDDFRDYTYTFMQTDDSSEKHCWPNVSSSVMLSVWVLWFENITLIMVDLSTIPGCNIYG